MIKNSISTTARAVCTHLAGVAYDSKREGRSLTVSSTAASNTKKNSKATIHHSNSKALRLFAADTKGCQPSEAKDQLGKRRLLQHRHNGVMKQDGHWPPANIRNTHTSMLNCRQSTDKHTPRQKHKAEHERANAHLRYATRAGVGGTSSHSRRVDISLKPATGEVTINEQVMMCVMGAQLQSEAVKHYAIISSQRQQPIAQVSAARCVTSLVNIMATLWHLPNQAIQYMLQQVLQDWRVRNPATRRSL